MHWYKHHIGDYLSDTPGLSMMEHGAYRLLLDAYYSNNGPLPSDPDYLYRVCRARSRYEKAAVDRVLASYFSNSQKCIKNARADQEILKYQAQCSANRRRIVPESGLQPVPNNQEPELNLKPLASPESGSAGANGSSVAYIPLVNGTEWGVSPAFQAELEAAYPEVDVPLTFKQIRAWCIANPQKRKTERGVARFINRWCEKEQNHG